MTGLLEKTLNTLVARFKSVADPYDAIMHGDYASSTSYALKYFPATAAISPPALESAWSDYNIRNIAARVGVAATLLQQTSHLFSLVIAAQIKLLSLPDRTEDDQLWLKKTMQENMDYQERKNNLMNEIHSGWSFIQNAQKNDPEIENAFRRAAAFTPAGDFEKMTVHELIAGINDLHAQMAGNWFKYADILLDMAEINMGSMAAAEYPTEELLTTRKQMTGALITFANDNLVIGTQHDLCARRALPPSFRKILN